jgi:hypothetical protein
MTAWTKDLASAPRTPAEGYAVLAILPGFSAPEAVHWEAYPDDIARELGEDGYWTFSIEIVADVTEGGIRPEEAASALWRLIDLPATTP